MGVTLHICHESETIDLLNARTLSLFFCHSLYTEYASVIPQGANRSLLELKYAAWKLCHSAVVNRP